MLFLVDRGAVDVGVVTIFGVEAQPRGIGRGVARNPARNAYGERGGDSPERIGKIGYGLSLSVATMLISSPEYPQSTTKSAALTKPSEDIDPSRRELLVRALASGLFAAGGAFSFRSGSAQPLGKVPKPLPAGRSFYEVSGPVTVNGKVATLATQVSVNDTVQTGKAARAIFVVGLDAFILRDSSRLELKGSGVFTNQLRLVTGALLSVFGKGARSVHGPTSTIGIRGTGLYLEAQPDLTYVCTCYGATDIAASDDPSISESIVSTHHDAPRYVLAKPDKGRRIIPAPFKNHTDLELTLIESLVGRNPPFSLFDESYGSPRRY